MGGSSTFRVPDPMASKAFKFLIGPNASPFNVDKETFAAISPVLRTLMTGKMREAIDGCAVWEDVEVDDFVGLCEFAYTGDYAVPNIDQTAKKFPVRPNDEADIEKYYKNLNIMRIVDFPSVSQSVSPGCGHTLFLRKFREKCVPLSNIRHLAVPKITTSSPDWTETFMRHARMYVLGDRYDVEGLRNIAFTRLACDLTRFTNTPDSLPSLESLIQFIYDNTVESDRIRDMLAMFTACIFENLILHPVMKHLFHEHFEFSRDVLQHVAERMRDHTVPPVQLQTECRRFI
ncbi:hypothetical protein F5B20DRAFT_36468 [Whalleya microplaca]|nr:hypothetical protein F5B20DRAFT_36468 [Whalleya microplaca]